MITISSDICQASVSTTKYITRLYNGKALPEVGKNLICLLSPCTNVSVTSLCTYWELLKQNAFSTDIKCVIVTDESSDINNDISISDVYSNLISDIRDSNDNFMEQDIIEVIDLNKYLEKTTIKKRSTTIKKMDIDKKSILFVIDVNDINNTNHTILNNIVMVDPDIIIFNNLQIQMDLISKVTKNIIGIPNKNTSIISFTNDEKSLDGLPRDHIYNIAYRTSTCFEKIITKSHTLHFDLMKLNTNTNMEQIMDKLNSCVRHVERQILIIDDDSLLTKKMIIILDSIDTVNKLYNHYKKQRCYYDCLADVDPYNSTDQEDVLNFPLISPYTSKLITSGILFISGENLLDVFNISNNAIDNIDFLIIFDNTLKQNHNMYRRLVTSLVSNDLPKQHLVYMELCEKNLHQQLHRLSKTFYDNNSTNVQLFNELKVGIESGMIRLDVDFNDMRQDKLERMLKITEADKRFDNRQNIIYIVTIPQSKASMIHNNYKTEENILNNDISDELLIDEFNAISTAKKGSRKIPKYSGAKWNGRSDKIELSGSKIGFVNEKTDTIEICEIIGVMNYVRREKLPDWKEKDCKNKNILYLSSIKDRYSLSNFKKIMKLKKSDRIVYMQEFEVNIDKLKIL
jgi:hypothetical protein